MTDESKGNRQLSEAEPSIDKQAALPPDDTMSPEETETYIDAYQITAEWIRFADAKAAAVLTVSGALAGFLIPTLKPFLDEPVHLTPWWCELGIGLFVAWMFFLLIACVAALQCILPFRFKGKHPAIGQCSHFHPAAISAAYGIDEGKRFVRDCEALGTAGFAREVLAGLLFDSHVSNSKYRYVTRSIRLLGVSTACVLLYLLVIQL